MAVTRVLAKRGTAAQIAAVSSVNQLSGEIAFATDTKEFYVSDGTQFNKIGKDQLSQFSEISVVTDIGTWTVNQDNALDLNPPEGNPTGITFKPDGTKVFTIGYSLNRVQMYDLSTAWDLTSAGSPTQSEYLVQNNLSSTQEDFFIDSSGTRMYVLSRSSDSIGQFTLNNAWDISDITFVQDVHLNSTGLSGGVAGFVTGEDNPMGITFKPDGTILYITGYSTDDVFQIPLSTAWDISTHGTITSVDVSLEGTPNAVQFNNDGTEMYVMGYTTDSIHYYSLSTAWDVTTASFVKGSPPFRGLEGTGAGFYYNETEQKSFICGRSTDFAYEVNVSEALKFTDPISAPTVQGDKVIANELVTGSTGRSDFYNAVYTHGLLQTNSTTYLGYNSGAQNVRIGNTVYGNYRFHVFQYNYIDSNFISAPTINLPNIRFFNPLIGGVGVFSIGKTHNTSSNYLLGGVTDIESEADTFDHKGEITLGGELKIAGNQPLKYKDPNLYTQGTQIVLDNFTEASDTDLLNHTPDTGSGYTQVFITSGTSSNLDYAKISGGNGYVSPARNNSNDGFRFTNDTTISTANYEARAVIKRQSTSDDPFVLVVKYIDEDNYFAMHFAGNYNYCTPISVVNGVYTQHGALYYYANTSSADNINIEVALRVVGNNVHLFYEGRYRGSREVNITGAGKAGIGFGRSQNSILTSYDLSTSAQISKFEVYELPDSLFDGSDSVHYIENGNLGIGTTSPGSSYKLDVEGNTRTNGYHVLGATGDIRDRNTHNQRFEVSSTYSSIKTSNTHRLYVTSTGNVGIGTTSPARPLHVDGSSGARISYESANMDLFYYGIEFNRQSNYLRPTTNSGKSLYIGSGSQNYTWGTVYLDAAVVQFRNSSSEPLMRFDSSTGRLGIGTTSPDHLLHVAGNAKMSNIYLLGNIIHEGDVDTQIKFATDTIKFDTAGSERLTINSTGNVGIGTTGPSFKLDVNAGTENIVASFSSTDQTAQLRIIEGSNVPFFFGVINSGAYISPTGATPADGISILNTGNVGIGIASPSVKLEIGTDGGGENKLRINSDVATKYLQFESLGNLSRIKATNAQNLLLESTGAGGYITFNANGAERMRVLYDGKVGIGTTSPAAKLDVEGLVIARNNGFQLRGTSPSTTTYTSIEQNGTEGVFRLYNGSNWGFIARGVGNNPYIGAYQNGSLRIRGFGQSDGDDDATDKDLATFDFATERVGIGTLNPSAKLDVVGNIKIGADQNIFSDGSITIGIDYNNNQTDRVFNIVANNSTEVFRVQEDGKVGIGTTSLSYAFNVNSGSAETVGFFKSTDSRARILISDDDTNTYVGSENGYGFFGGQASLSTANLVINSANGDVGIGTINPTAELHVEASNQSDVLLKSTGSSSVFTADGFVNSVFAMKENGTLKSEFFYDSINNQMKIRTSSAESLSLGVNNGQNIFIRGSDGNVGIGNTSPATKIDVDGTGRITDTVYLSTNANSKTGIGTTSPTEKLEVSGNIKASGTIKGKMEQMFACSFSDDLGTDKHYLSFTSNAEQTNVHADQAAMVMPYNGRVKSIQMRLPNIDADTTRTFGIETIAPGINMYAASNNWTIEETEAYELAATDNFYLVNYVFSNENHFESGDLLAISIQDTEDAYTASRQTYVNVIIEYDLNNGMGNDTATTKYTS